jgi:hypothetical protein
MVMGVKGLGAVDRPEGYLFFRHPSGRSMNLGIFSHLPFTKGGKGGFENHF